MSKPTDFAKPGRQLRPRVLIAAGDWGYGPVATAEVVAKNLLRSSEVAFSGRGLATSFTRRSPILTQCSLWDWGAEPSSFDLVVGIVEPTSVIEAHRAGVPSVSIDNLFWHWQWSDSDIERCGEVLRTSDGSVSQLVERLDQVCGYGSYCAMYLLSSSVLWQTVASPRTNTPSAMVNKSRWVQPLVMDVTSGDKRRRLLVSLSGGLVNPMSTEHMWTEYCRVLAITLSSGLEIALDRGWDYLIAAPIQLHEPLRKVAGLKAVDLEHSAFMRTLASASALAVPMGLSTTFEALSCQTPIFALPDIHDGNYLNYQGLERQCGYPLSNFDDVLPDAMISKYLNRRLGIDQLFEEYRAALLAGEQSGYLRYAESRFCRFMTKCTDEKDQETLAKRQSEVLHRIADPTIVVEDIQDILEHPNSTKLTMP